MTPQELLVALGERLDTDPPSEDERRTLLAMAGVAAHASERWAAPLACDLPLVPPQLLGWLATCEGTAVPSFGGVAQPLLARWDLSALPVLRAALEGGGSLRAAAVAAGANSIGEEELRRFGEPATFLADVDTPADLARVERLLAGARRIDVE